MKVYERKSFPRMARDLKSMYEKGTLSFDNAVQRSFVWKNTKKDNRMSLLIDSIIRGLPIPPMYCNCLFTDITKKIYDFLDGKQRTLTICKFLNNEFALVNVPTYEIEGKEYDFNGLKYSELPEYIQDKIRTCSLTVYYYENMDQEDAEEMFRRLNNGKTLTAIELTRVRAKSKKEIAELSSNEIFKLALSERALAGYANEDIVIKTWITLYSENKSWETKYVRPTMAEAIISKEQVEEIGRLYARLTGICNNLDKKVRTKVLRKTNLISLLPILQKESDDEKIMEWINAFFKTDTRVSTINEEYNDLSKGSSAQAPVVKRRIEILEASFLENIA